MNNAERPSKSLLTGPTISILIGKEQKQWILHRRLLSFHSPFFADGPEVKDDSLEFPHDDPAGWSLLVKYLYQGTLPKLSTFHSAIEKYNHAVACQKLYILTLRLSMPHLADLALDRFKQCLHAAHLVPDADELQEMYTTSPQGSDMRDLLIRIAARQIMDPGVERDVQAYYGCFEAEPEFAVGLVREIRRGTGGMLMGDPTAATRVKGHEGQGYKGKKVRFE